MSSLPRVATQLNDLAVDVLLAGVARGDLLFRGASKWNNLAPGTSGQVLQSGGPGADPSWVTVDLTSRLAKAGDTATGQLRFGFTGSAVNDRTQDSVQVRPTGALAANWRPLAIYLADGDATPVAHFDSTGRLLLNNPSSNYGRLSVNVTAASGVGAGVYVRGSGTGERIWVERASGSTAFVMHSAGRIVHTPGDTGLYGYSLTAPAGGWGFSVSVPSSNPGSAPIVNLTDAVNDVSLVAGARTVATVVGFWLGCFNNRPLYLGVNNATQLSLSTAALTLTDAINLAFGTTTGTKLGTATTQKLAFWNATPVVQPTAVADAAGGATVDAEARTAVNAILARLRTLGLIAT